MKCVWCGKEEKYNRKDVRYICISCHVYTQIGHTLVESFNEGTLTFQEVKDTIESMMHTNKMMDKAEKKYGLKSEAKK